MQNYTLLAIAMGISSRRGPFGVVHFDHHSTLKVTFICRLLFRIVGAEWLQVIHAQRLVEWFFLLHVGKVTQSAGDHSDCPRSSPASFFVAESEYDDHPQDRRACALSALRKRPF
jgi:hypothetical protein